jgi:hypothetical protein
VSAVYADNSGYFLKGFADGFNKGFQMGMQIKQKREMKWKAEQLEELEKVFEQWDIFADTVQKLVESGQMTPELGRKFLVLNSLLPMDLQEHGQSLYNGIMSVDKDKVIIVESDFSYTTSQSELKYNSFEDKWEYAPPGSTPKYNAFENKWEFASPEDKTKYNPFENKWSYENPNTNLKYNPFQNKWEYAPSGSVLKYNPFADSWSYE